MTIQTDRSTPGATKKDINRPDRKGWFQIRREQSNSLTNHDVSEWVQPSSNGAVKSVTSDVIYSWVFDKDGKQVRDKSRIVV